MELPSPARDMGCHQAEESANPDHPLGWSEWIAQKVNLALNVDVLRVETKTDLVETHHLQRQIAKLQDRIRELESREIGVSDTRILRIISDGYTDFGNIAQGLYDTEKAADGKIECDETGSRWRLKA